MVTQLLAHQTESAAEDSEDRAVEVVAVGDAEHLQDAQGQEVA
jgi:hypothetical protein